MRILFITRKHPPETGGMENLSYNLIMAFKERNDCQADTIILNRKQIHLLWWFPYALFLALFRAGKADFVHLGDPALSLIGFFVKLIYKKPIAVTVHGLDVTFRFLPYQWYIKIFGRRFDNYICISQYALEQAKKRGFFPLVVIPVGVDFKKCKDQPSSLESQAERRSKMHKEDFLEKYSLPSDKRILLTVGRLVKRKGVYWFTDKVMPDLPKNIVYFIVGNGEDRERIKRLIAQRKLDRRVYLLGRIPEQDLIEIYRLADLFIMPNIKVKNDMEGFGLVALEAGLNDLPVVAAGIEGIRDAISDKENGFLVASEVASAFEEKILELLSDPSLSLSFGEKARRYNQEHYDWKVIAKRYLDEFLKVQKV